MRWEKRKSRRHVGYKAGLMLHSRPLSSGMQSEIRMFYPDIRVCTGLKGYNRIWGVAFMILHTGKIGNGRSIHFALLFPVSVEQPSRKRYTPSLPFLLGFMFQLVRYR
jgi:hypothetical protein